MTDIIQRQAVIEAVRSVPPGTPCRGDAIIAAINAIPAVTVTDEMVERAAIAHWSTGPVLAWDELDQHDRDFLSNSMKAALVAALGE
jgi:hypothetical protein